MITKRNEILPPPPPFPSLRVEEHKFRKGKTDHEFKELEKEDHFIHSSAKITRQQKEKKKNIDDLGFDVHSFLGISKFEVPKPSIVLPDIVKTNDVIHQDIAASEESTKEIQEAISKIHQKKKGIEVIKGFFARNNVASVKKAPIQKLVDLLDDCRKKVSGIDIEGAKRTYIEIMHIYNQLSHSEKKEVYQQITDLYSMRKKAENMIAKI